MTSKPAIIPSLSPQKMAREKPFISWNNKILTLLDFVPTNMFLCVILLVVLNLSSVVRCEKYTNKYDNIDMDEILQSERLLKNYFNCLMDRGPCTPDGAELRRILPEALATACEKCSDNQKEGTKKIIKKLVKGHPDMWQELRAKYDPNDVYYNKYKEQLD